MLDEEGKKRWLARGRDNTTMFVCSCEDNITAVLYRIENRLNSLWNLFMKKVSITKTQTHLSEIHWNIKKCFIKSRQSWINWTQVSQTSSQPSNYVMSLLYEFTSMWHVRNMKRTKGLCLMDEVMWPVMAWQPAPSPSFTRALANWELERAAGLQLARSIPSVCVRACVVPSSFSRDRLMCQVLIWA